MWQLLPFLSFKCGFSHTLSLSVLKPTFKGCFWYKIKSTSIPIKLFVLHHFWDNCRCSNSAGLAKFYHLKHHHNPNPEWGIETAYCGFSKRESQPFPFRLFFSHEVYLKIFLHPKANLYKVYECRLGGYGCWTTCRFLGRQDLRFLNNESYLREELRTQPNHKT